MKVFTTVGFRTNHYYIVNDDGVIFASSKPFFDGDNFFKSEFQSPGVLVSMCNLSLLNPYNKEAKDFVDKVNGVKTKRERNKHVIAVIVCVAITVGSIFIGVWS
ncbi:TPA: hypothetical protein K7O19_004042 [Salmonella enterica subsp. enterica serovar Infantis]|nr:hypothetical protein [Salmonella enterica]HBI4576223.1 hypothetical protein [Salmonella enterica subsp. enterica serovar Infantis]